MDDISSELRNLIDATFSSAIDTATTIGVPFHAFVLVDDEAGRSLHRFVVPRLEDSVMHAQNYVMQRPDALRMTLALDGYVPFQGRRWDALVVQAFDTVFEVQIAMAQRYEKIGLLRKKASLVGTPIQLG
jgi:hypothetical protein